MFKSQEWDGPDDWLWCTSELPAVFLNEETQVMTEGRIWKEKYGDGYLKIKCWSDLSRFITMQLYVETPFNFHSISFEMIITQLYFHHISGLISHVTMNIKSLNLSKIVFEFNLKTTWFENCFNWFANREQIPPAVHKQIKVRAFCLVLLMGFFPFIAHIFFLNLDGLHSLDKLELACVQLDSLTAQAVPHWWLSWNYAGTGMK